MDYDLVVVGNNAAARWSAIAAKQYSARVALVALAPDIIPTALLLQTWAKIRQRQNEDRINPTLSFKEWAAAMVYNLTESRSPAQLASMGIEQINGVAQFQQKPQLQVHVENRVLRSRQYLLSLDATLPVPEIPGLNASDYLTPVDLLQYSDLCEPQLANPIIILGDGPLAATLSQALVRLGNSVSLISSHSHVLPWEDTEAAFWVQAHLEAEGVKIYTHCPIEAVQTQLHSTHEVITQEGTFTAQSIIWADESPSAVLELNLVTVKLRHTPQGVWVNPNLQTSQPHLYACGSILGGYSLLDLAQYEATVAVKNALFWKQHRVNYQTVPVVIATEPTLARVGLTEAQAQQRQLSFQVLCQSYQDTHQGQLQQQTSGWCKLIVDNNRQILGAHIVGTAAAELIQWVALGMKKQCPITEFAKESCLPSSYTAVIGQAARQWRSP
ncbi:MAG: NAD(P)/FAD-dependent oxidoreductase [Acaryochloridaceae cyanobacterium CSU_3_4]|nr:NAD(P)/FAD-dependent oxidoreductase [Acaryochloridaceae cyanobacterium CSU_3_4]